MNISWRLDAVELLSVYVRQLELKQNFFLPYQSRIYKERNGEWEKGRAVVGFGEL